MLTRNNLSKVRDFPLQVFEAGSNLQRNNWAENRREVMLHGINVWRNIIALNIVVTNRTVKHHLKIRSV